MDMNDGAPDAARPGFYAASELADGVAGLGMERLALGTSAQPVAGGAVPEGEGAAAPVLSARAGVPQFAGGASARLIAPDIWWVGAADKRLALFENAFPLTHGMEYNSYLIVDEKVVLVETIDRAASGQFFENISAVLGDRPVDYVIMDHAEPDHSATLGQVLARWPNARLVCTGLGAKFASQFFTPDLLERCIIAKEGDVLVTGRHALEFVEAPWVHWPEVMMSLDVATGVLFSADAFGTFGALDGNIFADQMGGIAADRLAEYRRYYANIVGKYGPYTAKALDKLASSNVAMLCPTHGPMWRTDLDKIIDKYRHWATYKPEDQAVAIYCASIYGGTESAANMLAARLSAAGVPDVRVYDVASTHTSYLLAEAFRCSHLVFASVTYNNGMFSAMRNLLAEMSEHHMQGRHVSFIENGTWHANSGKLMRAAVSAMPDMIEVGESVALKSTVSPESAAKIDALAIAIAASLRGDEEEAHETRLSDPLPPVDTTSGASRKSH
jgi:flavorubredoxin